MAIFQGENIKFKIVLKDNGVVVSTAPSVISDISAKVYLESNSKVYLEYTLNGVDNGPLSRRLVNDGFNTGYLMEIYAVDSITMPPGRYIIQVKYKTVDADFQGGDLGKKINIQKGVLITILKSV